jgi:predicted O-methyltransferase YrrM
MNHFYDSVEGWFNESDKNIYDKMINKYQDGDTFVEIGSFKGRSASIMAVNIANSNKDIKFYCVDTWLGSEEHQEGGAYADRDAINGSLLDIFLNNTKNVSTYITPVQKLSTEAANDFEDNSLSFVFIDASHDYQSVKNDINAWYPKIKSGGTLAGHDWNYQSVQLAVIEFAQENNFNIESTGCWEIIITK